MIVRPTLAAVLALAVAAHAQTGAPVQTGRPNVPDNTPAFPNQTRAPEMRSDFRVRQRDFVAGLENPWGIAALPDGGFLVTERPGRLRHVSAAGRLSPPITGLPPVHAERQGGLLDVALAPDFEETRRIFWTYAKPLGRGLSATAAASGILSEDLSEIAGVADIFVQHPPSPSPMHYGSRIVFDGQGRALITTGEHSSGAERVLAQDLNTTYGKVIRVDQDGTVPSDNPFFSEAGAVPTILSSGHRNPQGAAIHPETGELWTIEHGPRGGDELNRIAPGANYGWPVVSYGENYSGTPVGSGEAAHAPRGFVEPIYYWDPVIAPGGMVFYQGDMFPEWRGDILAGGLVAQSLVRLDLAGDRVRGEEWIAEGVGRVRDVEIAPDGSLILLIDAANGRLVRLTREKSSP